MLLGELCPWVLQGESEEIASSMRTKISVPESGLAGRYLICNSSAEKIIESIYRTIKQTMKVTEVRLLLMSFRDQGAIDQINR